MLTFLRKVRRRLLSENRITRYLAYAVGEIILVVIGIMIAIQLNTLKQESDLKAEMNQLLSGVHRDLLADSIRQDFIREYYLGHTAAIQDLLEVRNGTGKMENEAIGRTMIPLFFFENYNKVRSTYESMISGGKMQYLDDRRLSNMMVRYYNSEGLEITTDVYGEILVSFDRQINESANLIAHDRLFSESTLQKYIPNFRPAADTVYRSDFKKVLQEPWVDDFLVNSLNQSAYIFGSLKSASELNLALRKMIRTYLRERGAEVVPEQNFEF